MEHFEHANQVFHAEPMTRWHKAVLAMWSIAVSVAIGAVFGALIWLATNA